MRPLWGVLALLCVAVLRPCQAGSKLDPDLCYTKFAGTSADTCRSCLDKGCGWDTRAGHCAPPPAESDEPFRGSSHRCQARKPSVLGCWRLDPGRGGGLVVTKELLKKQLYRRMRPGDDLNAFNFGYKDFCGRGDATPAGYHAEANKVKRTLFAVTHGLRPSPHDVNRARELGHSEVALVLEDAVTAHAIQDRFDREGMVGGGFFDSYLSYTSTDLEMMPSSLAYRMASVDSKALDGTPPAGGGLSCTYDDDCARLAMDPGPSVCCYDGVLRAKGVCRDPAHCTTSHTTLEGVFRLRPDDLAAAGKTVIDRMDDPKLVKSAYDARQRLADLKCVSREVLDQRTCGTCWAFATAAVVSQRLCLASMGVANVDVSPQTIVETVKFGDAYLTYMNNVRRNAFFGSKKYKGWMVKDRRMQGSGVVGVRALQYNKDHGGANGAYPQYCRPYGCMKLSSITARILTKWLARGLGRLDSPQEDLLRDHRVGVVHAAERFKSFLHTPNRKQQRMKNDFMTARLVATREQDMAKNMCVEKEIPTFTDAKDPYTMNYLQVHGFEAVFPYRANRVATASVLRDYTATVEAIEREIWLNGPILIGISTELLRFYNNHAGVWRGHVRVPVAMMTKANHDVAVVGWGTDDAEGLDYWIVQNSWGKDWGSGGYIKIQKGFERRCLTDKLTDRMGKACGMDLFAAMGLYQSFTSSGEIIGPRISEKTLKRWQGLHAEADRKDCGYGHLLLDHTCHCDGAWKEDEEGVCRECGLKCDHGSPDPETCQCVCEAGYWGDLCESSVEMDVCDYDVDNADSDTGRVTVFRLRFRNVESDSDAAGRSTIMFDASKDDRGFTVDVHKLYEESLEIGQTDFAPAALCERYALPHECMVATPGMAVTIDVDMGEDEFGERRPAINREVLMRRMGEEEGEATVGAVPDDIPVCPEHIRDIPYTRKSFSKLKRMKPLGLGRRLHRSKVGFTDDRPGGTDDHTDVISGYMNEPTPPALEDGFYEPRREAPTLP